jgi:hypothetical protein
VRAPISSSIAIEPDDIDPMLVETVRGRRAAEVERDECKRLLEARGWKPEALAKQVDAAKARLKELARGS